MSAIPAISTRPSPPGPRALPIVGNLQRLWGTDAPHIAISKAARRHDDVVQFRLGNRPMVALSHHDIAGEACQRRCTGDHFAVSATWLHAVRILHRLRLETRGGVFLPEDEVWGVSTAPKPYSPVMSRRP